MTEKNMWNLSPQEALKACQASEQGLTTEQAEKIRLEKGENVLLEEKKKSAFQVFLDQFKDLMVVILIGAAIISMFSGNEESTIVIFAVLVMNAVLGTVQHMKAEKSLESLKQLSAPDAKVIRDGRKQEIPAKDVVPGDILELEAGDMVAADGRILHNYSLQVNESSLTGESTNVDKQEMALNGEAALADRTNMVYSGSLVTYGRATVLVTATGMNTEIGKIAGLMNGAEERKTPLQKSLDQFSGKLAVLIMVVCALVFALCMFRKMSLLDALLFAVALAVAAIPEALTSIVTIVQAFGTQKMAKENAIIKKLKAVESLGCVSVICSDKTGTLTQNKMTVQQVYVDGKVIDGKELDLTDQTQRYLLYDAVLTNDSSIVDGKGIGDPTEYALLEMFRKIQVLPDSYFGKMGMHEDALRKVMDRIEEVPFDSDRKLMSTKYRIHGVPTILTKGAVDVLLDRCVSVRYGDGIRPMTEEEKENYVPQWTAGMQVSVADLIEASGVADQNGAMITLYASWDDCPWIVATNLYYTLEQAKQGIITDSEILSHATASDREDGSPIEAGFHENGTSFSVPDYQASDFTQFLRGGSCTENLTVVDSAGSIYCKQITVYVVDTTPADVRTERTTRFIDEKYYGSSYERGGLLDDSIWKTDTAYVSALRTAFGNLENDAPVETYMINGETRRKIREYVDAHGFGDNREAGALQEMYDRYLVPNCVR